MVARGWLREQTCVPGDLARLDSRVGVLGLQEQLHTLDGGNDGLGDTSSRATGGQIGKELHGLVLRGRGDGDGGLLLGGRDHEGPLGAIPAIVPTLG